MMRIAYVINSMEGGGAQTPLPKIVAALAKAGARVRVLALTRRNGHAIERLQAAGIDPLVREGGESDQFAAYRWICEQAREWGADAIWTSLTRATLLGQIAGIAQGIARGGAFAHGGKVKYGKYGHMINALLVTTA